MLNRPFRPWGSLGWVMAHMPAGQWSALCCLASEHRCTAAWMKLAQTGSLYKSLYIRIIDPPSRFTVTASSMCSERRAEVLAVGVPSEGIVDVDLFAPDARIVSLVDDFIALS